MVSRSSTKRFIMYPRITPTGFFSVLACFMLFFLILLIRLIFLSDNVSIPLRGLKWHYQEHTDAVIELVVAVEGNKMLPAGRYLQLEKGVFKEAQPDNTSSFDFSQREMVYRELSAVAQEMEAIVRQDSRFSDEYQLNKLIEKIKMNESSIGSYRERYNTEAAAFNKRLNSNLYILHHWFGEFELVTEEMIKGSP